MESTATVVSGHLPAMGNDRNREPSFILEMIRYPSHGYDFRDANARNAIR